MQYNPRISIICALSENRVIGSGDRIPWHIREDLLRFKEKTLHHTVIMGRATFESVAAYYKRSGRPIPDRRHIIVTRDTSYDPGMEGCYVADSIEKALTIARDIEPEEVFVSGGEQIFKQTISLAQRLYLTVVAGDYAGDKFFPDYSAFKKIINKQEREEKGVKFMFLDMER
jgi:dihydrofolate reductase